MSIECWTAAFLSGTKRVLLPALCALAVSGVPSVQDAAAQGAPAATAPKLTALPSKEDKRRARNAVRKGNALAEQGQHAKALEQYQLADSIMGVPFTRMRVADGHAKLGQLVKARENARSIADIPIRSNEPPAFIKARAEAQQLIKEAGAKIAVITFTIEPASAIVSEATLDGQALTPAALRQPLELDPGKHELAIKAPGHQPLEHKMAVREGERATVSLQLRAAPKVVPEFVIDEEPQPVEPWAEEGGGLAAISPVAWIGFGVAGAGLITGAVTGSLAVGRRSELEDACTNGQCQPELHNALDSGRLLGHISTAGFAVAGVGVALGVVGLLVFSPIDEEAAGQETVTLSPYVSPTSIGFRGSF